MRVAIRNFAAAAVALIALVGASGAIAGQRQALATDTLIFGAASDPVSLDAALVSDGESRRIVTQIYETLVTHAPGTTRLVPGLARAWSKSPDGLTWRFTLRQGVTFHDGTSLNAGAVCANFDRWYGLRGAQQSGAVSVYYNVVFIGFKDPEPGAKGPEDALYRSCAAPNAATAVIKLRRPFGPFLGALTLTAFSIQSPTALAGNGADKGRLTKDGIYVPEGNYGTPGGVAVGTGPFKLLSWTIGDKLELVRNDGYWGRDAKLRRLVFLPIATNEARLQALKADEIQGYDLVDPQDVETITGDASLKIVDRPAFNVGYVTINQAVAPFNDLKVRQAVAHALDRETVVSTLYRGRGTVAHELQPPSVAGYSMTVVQYAYDPAKARQLLREAGLKPPVKVEFWYPRNIARPYMPDPKRNFKAFAAGLNKSGFKVIGKTAPWRPDYLNRVDSGHAGALNLIGWTGDYADPEAFLGGILRVTDQFGLNNATGERLYADLNAALVETEVVKRNALYRRINGFIMRNVLAVPYVHTEPALAFRRTVVGYRPSATGLERFSSVNLVGE